LTEEERQQVLRAAESLGVTSAQPSPKR